MAWYFVYPKSLKKQLSYISFLPKRQEFTVLCKKKNPENPTFMESFKLMCRGLCRQVRQQRYHHEHRELVQELESRILLSGAATAATLISDNFSGSAMNANIWHIPDWYLGGTYYGHTQNPCQPAALPGVQNGVANIGVQTYNWSSTYYNPSYFGDRVISNTTFTPGGGFHLTVDLSVDLQPGTIFAAYLYYPQGYGDPATQNNEVDFEFIYTDKGPQINTNIYAGSSLGVGNPLIVTLPKGGSIGDFHKYELVHAPGEGVQWLIDGTVVRIDNTNKLDENTELTVQLGAWVDVPGGFGYDPRLPSPTVDSGANQRWNMHVNNVTLTTVPVQPPAVQITNVPDIGTANASVQGIVTGVKNPADWRIVTYIKVNGNLWGPKPTLDQPLTTINADKTFSCLFTTGGNDVNATEIDTFLVPATFSPPTCLGLGALPSSLSAYASATVTRANNAGFVNNLYWSVLERAADTGGLSYWVNLLKNNQVTESQVANAFLSSTEYFNNEVRALYHQVLNRDADIGGLNGWTSYLIAGHSFQDLQAQFYGSAEYCYGRSATTLVGCYYAGLLGRSADPDGLTYWSGLLDKGMPSSTVASAIGHSTEGLTVTISSAYWRFLGRQADPGGQSFWVDQLQSGVSQENVFLAFTTSTEFLNK